MTDDDKEFIIRALAMHAALTKTFSPENMDIDEQASCYEKWIRRSIEGTYAKYKSYKSAPLTDIYCEEIEVKP